MTTNTKKNSPISVFDLTVAQVEGIEEEMGLPVTKWGDTPSMAKLLSAVLAAVEGNERSVYAGLTLQELMDRVDLTGNSSPEA